MTILSKVMGEDRMLFATDYPYESLSQSINFIKDCHLSKNVMEKLCHGNAKNFGIVPA
ncbi:MAG: amidohydrolase family protein [Alphaproteobacteria bacterium]|nr:amidohydrolase family protein [Alphaproteobacteria bacterium]